MLVLPSIHLRPLDGLPDCYRREFGPTLQERFRSTRWLARAPIAPAVPNFLALLVPRRDFVAEHIHTMLHAGAHEGGNYIRRSKGLHNVEV